MILLNQKLLNCSIKFHLQPTGNASDPYWTSGDVDNGLFVYAEVATEGNHIGIGLNGVWGAGAGVKWLTGETVRERAEVWFDKS